MVFTIPRFRTITDPYLSGEITVAKAMGTTSTRNAGSLPMRNCTGELQHPSSQACSGESDSTRHQRSPPDALRRTPVTRTSA